jgi:hypothetical protein
MSKHKVFINRPKSPGSPLFLWQTFISYQPISPLVPECDQIFGRTGMGEKE